MIFRKSKQQGVCLLLAVIVRSVGSQQCESTLLRLPPSEKTSFTVGVLANRGVETANKELNFTFGDYLTQTAGIRFEPPLKFKMIPVPFRGDIVDTFVDGTYDFIYANPSIQSCISTENGLNLVASVIARRVIGGQEHHLTQFGGVIFTLASNSEINSLADLEGRKIAAISINGLGSGQMQFREMLGAGIDYLQSPQQIIFTGNQGKIVNLVLDGSVDVGFVRTDQLERTIDKSTGELVDLSLIKILNVKEGLKIGEEPFPFTASTVLYPDWVVTSLPHVPEEVSEEVRASLLALDEHAALVPHLEMCYAQYNCTDAICEDGCFARLDRSLFSDCGTTRGLAFDAKDARTRGKYTGWRSPLSIMDLRNMQEEIGFMLPASKTSKAQCIRSNQIGDAVVCPEGFAKKNAVEIERSCEREDLDCFGFACICSPCERVLLCDQNTIKVGSRCVPFEVLVPSVLGPSTILLLALVFVYLEHKKKLSDAIWRVKPEELSFHDPPRVLGRGTFGLVLLGEYRGTSVAVKRILPRKEKSTADSTEQLGDTVGHGALGRDSVRSLTKRSSVMWNLRDLHNKHGVGKSASFFDFQGDKDTSRSAKASIEKTWANEFENSMTDIENYDGSAQKQETGESGTKSSSSADNCIYDQLRSDKQYAKLQKEFIEEMRHFAKMRHPCITTVMGAVISSKSEPMLIMECMELGSLYDLLHNDSMLLEISAILPMLHDIARGLRFLHSAVPQVVHGDLKCQNVLVDSKFRAKVSDFGFSQKKILTKRVTGTPFWMAPELLRGETANTAMSDMYSYGVVLFEVFSRKEPYEDEEETSVLQAVADPRVCKRPEIPSSCPTAICELMKFCWKEDPSDRPTAEEIDVRMRLLDAEAVEPGVSKDYSSLSKKSSDSARTEALLYDMFPRRVASALRGGCKVEPETFNVVTVCFMDIVGYTPIASRLTAQKVSSLLDRLYTKLDKVSRAHNVFKVETIGDAYMVVTNLAEKQSEHVGIMVRFVDEALYIARNTLIDEDDPSLGFLEMRAGVHSGPVVAHVLGSRSPRYSIIGDTVNTAARMESTSEPGRIQLTEEAAQLLVDQSPSIQTICRGLLQVKGKGEMTTFWASSVGGLSEQRSTDFGEPHLVQGVHSREVLERLIDWNVATLSGALQQIKLVPKHETQSMDPQLEFSNSRKGGAARATDVQEVISIFPYVTGTGKALEDPQNPELPAPVLTQLREFVSTIAHSYRVNHYHNFEHACHSMLSLSKFLASVSEQEDTTHQNVVTKYSRQLITNPLIQFAMLFSTLIHDIDHPGVSNIELVRRGSVVAKHYHNKNVVEQNAIDIAWAALVEPQFSDLRTAIAGSIEQWNLFRHLIVDGVIMTNLRDNYKEVRESASAESLCFNDGEPSINKASTMVLESILQAADIAHTMQDWGIYRKWNAKLFNETQVAFTWNAGEIPPGNYWYQSELSFFDSVVIPLATKIKGDGMFGNYGDECLRQAMENRKSWEAHGKRITEELIEKSNTL